MLLKGAPGRSTLVVHEDLKIYDVDAADKNVISNTN